MAGSLEGPLAKLDRADRQFGQLHEDIYTVWPAQRWPLHAERSADNLEYRFHVGDLPDKLDPDWLLVTGEILFDLRSALDHLAYELHVRHFRGRVPRDVEGRSQFPIYNDEQAFSANHGRIGSLSMRDQRALRWLQPFNDRSDGWEPVRLWLSKLNAVHNIDKHRRLHQVAAAQSIASEPVFPDDLGFRTTPVWGPVVSGAHVDTWTFTKSPDGPVVHPGAIVEVTLNPLGEWVTINMLLSRTIECVRAVLYRFRDRFPPVSEFQPPWPERVPDGPYIIQGPVPSIQ
jgi:hypothetical protein